MEKTTVDKGLPSRLCTWLFIAVACLIPLLLISLLVVPLGERLSSADVAMLRSSRIRQLIKTTPRDQVVTETDAPFAVRPERLIASLDEVQRFLAEAWDIERDDAVRQVAKNVRRLVGYRVARVGGQDGGLVATTHQEEFAW
jgi:hypothetical protein